MTPLWFGAALRAGLGNAISLGRGSMLVFLTRAAEGMLGPLLVAGAGGVAAPLRTGDSGGASSAPISG
jgi:hypothetical protein